MGRTRDPDREKAEIMFRESAGKIALKDIAHELNKPEGTVRGWKAKDHWDDKLNGTLPINTERSKTHKGPGAPKGNKNAIGNKGGGPPGNIKALKTGEYQSIWYDTLDQDELALIGLINTDPIFQCEQTIKFLTIRERRMMMRIADLRAGLTETQKRILQERKKVRQAIPIFDEMTGTSRIVVKDDYALVTTEMVETEFRKIDDIIRLEEALTRVQDKKIKALEQRVRIEKIKAETARLTGGEDEAEDDGFLNALEDKVDEVWGDDE